LNTCHQARSELNKTIEVMVMRLSRERESSKKIGRIRRLKRKREKESNENEIQTRMSRLGRIATWAGFLLL